MRSRAFSRFSRAFSAADQTATGRRLRVGAPLGGEHPLVGRSLPDFALTDGRKAGEALRTGKGLLLDFEARAPLRALAQRWDGRIAYVGCDAQDRLGLQALFVRPDGVVAWASAGEPNPKDIIDVATRWLGDSATTG